MPIFGIGLLFAGYSLAYYGASQTQGWNFGLLDLTIPGRWSKVRNNARDSLGAPAPQIDTSTGNTSANGTVTVPNLAIGSRGTNPSGVAIGGNNPAGDTLGSAADKANFPPNGYQGPIG